MGTRSRREPETRQSDGLRARDRKGNVRPADDRYLTDAQKAKRDAYVAEVHDRDGAPAPVSLDTETVDELVTRLNDERGVPTPGREETKEDSTDE